MVIVLHCTALLYSLITIHERKGEDAGIVVNQWELSCAFFQGSLYWIAGFFYESRFVPFYGAAILDAPYYNYIIAIIIIES